MLFLNDWASCCRWQHLCGTALEGGFNKDYNINVTSSFIVFVLVRWCSWSVDQLILLFCCCMTGCDHVLMIAEAESFERWLDRPTEDVGYKTESLHTEQQAACECLLCCLWIYCFATIQSQTRLQDAADVELMLWKCPRNYRAMLVQSAVMRQ